MAVVSDAISTPIVVRSVTAIVDSFVRRVAASLADAARKRQARQTDGNRSSKTSHFHCQAPSMCRDSVCRPNKLLTEKAGAKATDLIAALPRQYIRGRGEHSRRKVGSFLPKARVAADGRLRCTMRVFPRDASKVVDGVAPSAPGRLGQQCEIWPLRCSSPSIHDATPRLPSLKDPLPRLRLDAADHVESASSLACCPVYGEGDYRRDRRKRPMVLDFSIRCWSHKRAPRGTGVTVLGCCLMGPLLEISARRWSYHRNPAASSRHTNGRADRVVGFLRSQRRSPSRVASSQAWPV